MLVTRLELRKLRNKIYVRIISKQNFQNHLRQYSSLTEALISSSGSRLLPAEIADLRSRLELTKKAAAAASTPSSKSADLFFEKKDSQWQVKQQMVSTVLYISSMVRPLNTTYKAKSNQYQSCSMGSSIQVEDSHLSELVDGGESPELEAAFPHPASESDLATTTQLASRTSLGSSPCSPVGVETISSSFTTRDLRRRIYNM